MSLKSFLIASLCVHIVGGLFLYFHYNPIRLTPPQAVTDLTENSSKKDPINQENLSEPENPNSKETLFKKAEKIASKFKKPPLSSKKSPKKINAQISVKKKKFKPTKKISSQKKNLLNSIETISKSMPDIEVKKTKEMKVATKTKKIEENTDTNPPNKSEDLEETEKNTDINPPNKSEDLEEIEENTDINPPNKSEDLEEIEENTDTNPPNKSEDLEEIEENTDTNPPNKSEDLEEIEENTDTKSPNKSEDLKEKNLLNSSASLVSFRNFQSLKQKRGNPPLTYPEFARRAGMEGAVTLLFFITKFGLVEKIQVESSSGHSELDNFVIRTLSRYEFVFGQEAWVRLKVPFILDGKKIERLRLRENK